MQHSKKPKIKIYISNYLSPRKITFHGWSRYDLFGFYLYFFPQLDQTLFSQKKFWEVLTFNVCFIQYLFLFLANLSFMELQFIVIFFSNKNYYYFLSKRNFNSFFVLIKLFFFLINKFGIKCELLAFRDENNKSKTLETKMAINLISNRKIMFK